MTAASPATGGRRVARGLLARGGPATVSLGLVLTGVSIASWVMVARAGRPLTGTGFDALVRHHDLLSLLTGALVAETPLELVVAVGILVVVVGRVEHAMGSSRVLLAFVATAVLGNGLGILLGALGSTVGLGLQAPPLTDPIVDPSTPVAGTLLAASAFVGPLWRRRIRVLGLSVLVVALLYSGHPADLCRLTGGAVGVGLGMLLARRLPALRWPRSSHHEVRSLLAAVVAVGAFGPVLALVVRHGYGLLRPIGLLFRDTLPGAASLRGACRAAIPAAGCARDIALARLNGPGPVLLTVLPLLVLLVAAVGVWRGRAVGAWAAIGVNLLLASLAALYFGVLPDVRDPDQLLDRARQGMALQPLLAVLVPLGIAIALLVATRHLDVLPSRRALRILLGVVGGTFVAVAALYVGLGSMLAARFTPRVTPFDLLADLPERFVPVGFLRLRRLDFLPTGVVTRLLYDWVGPVFWAVVLVSLAVALTSVRSQALPSDLQRARALLRRGSQGSLGHMATWAGNRYWFSPDGRAGVAYREITGVAVTLGEPFGDPAAVAEAGRGFAVHCDDAGMTCAFYAVRPEFAAQLAAGEPWPSVVIAEDTVLHPATFSMTGKRWADVRSSINRADRLGVTAVWTDWEHCGVRRREQVAAISEEWVAERRLPELGFTLGGLRELRDPEVKLMLAVTADDRVEGVTSWLPTWRDGELIGWTLDFMRRRPEGMNGVMEFLIASVAGAAQQRGLEFVSLSAAPLAVGDDGGEGSALDRSLDVLARILEPVYGFTALAQFKDKFQPTLEPLVLAYADPIGLPAIGAAIARAYLPDLSLPGALRIVNALR